MVCSVARGLYCGRAGHGNVCGAAGECGVWEHLYQYRKSACRYCGSCENTNRVSWGQPGGNHKQQQQLHKVQRLERENWRRLSLCVVSCVCFLVCQSGRDRNGYCSENSRNKHWQIIFCESGNLPAECGKWRKLCAAGWGYYLLWFRFVAVPCGNRFWLWRKHSLYDRGKLFQ